MRIGLDLLSEKGTPGGIHTYTNELIDHLVALGREDPAYAIELVVFAPEGYRYQLDAAALSSIRFVTTRCGRLPAPARRVLQHAMLPSLARKYRVDLVHSVNNVVPGGLSTPSVVTVHDLSPFALPHRFGYWKTRYLKSAVPASVRRATRVISVSQATRVAILTWVPDVVEDKVVVVPSGVGARFTPERAPHVERDHRERLDLPGEFILYVGLVEPGKNLVGVSRALARLKRAGITIPWVVAGHGGDHLAFLKRLWRELGIEDLVHHVGPVPVEALPHLYRMARAFVFPSHHEGFGLPVVEAFSCGTPVITSNRSSLPEVAGRAALQVSPDDVEEIATALRRVWLHESLRRLLRQRGLERASHFRWRETARRTHAVYLEALGQPPLPCVEVGTGELPVVVLAGESPAEPDAEAGPV